MELEQAWHDESSGQTWKQKREGDSGERSQAGLGMCVRMRGGGERLAAELGDGSPGREH